MPIYFVRHGESEANVKGLFAGQRDDSPLTDLGRSQAAGAGAEVMNLNIARIYASPLSRAKETAEIIAHEIGYPVDEIEFDNRILEYDMGSLTGTLRADAEKNRALLTHDAENKQAFLDRVTDFLREHADSEANVLLVSHAGVGRMIETARIGLPPEEFMQVEGYPNAHVVKLDLSWVVP